MLVALTGTLGSGKSTVLKMFKEMGARTISADQVVHDLLQDPQIKNRLRDLFGDVIFDESGQVDRRALAKIIFSNEKAKKELEALLHPLVFDKVYSFYKKKPNTVTVAEIPLLFETKSQDRFHKVITVYTPLEIAKKRLKSRGMTEREIEARLKNQLPIETKLEKADFIIDNSQGLEATKSQVAELMTKLTAG